VRDAGVGHGVDWVLGHGCYRGLGVKMRWDARNDVKMESVKRRGSLFAFGKKKFVFSVMETRNLGAKTR
jgi:hypothetical protein